MVILVIVVLDEVGGWGVGVGCVVDDVVYVVVE